MKTSKPDSLNKRYVVEGMMTFHVIKEIPFEAGPDGTGTIGQIVDGNIQHFYDRGENVVKLEIELPKPK
jgi:hypothetical protein